MTIKQLNRLQNLMLKDEMRKLTEAEHNELFELLELAETEANEEVNHND